MPKPEVRTIIIRYTNPALDCQSHLHTLRPHAHGVPDAPLCRRSLWVQVKGHTRLALTHGSSWMLAPVSRLPVVHNTKRYMSKVCSYICTPRLAPSRRDYLHLRRPGAQSRGSLRNDIRSILRRAGCDTTSPGGSSHPSVLGSVPPNRSVSESDTVLAPAGRG